jgi:hypothetical protein
MPQPTDIRLRAFPEAPSPFTLTDKLSDENGNVLVTLTDTMDGTMSAQAVGSDIELTIRVNDESVGTGSSLVAPKYTHNSGTMQVLRSSDGVINRVSMPKSGFIWPHYGESLQAVEALRGTVRQDQVVTLSNQVAGSQGSANMLSSTKLVARGRGTFRGRPVIVFSYRNDVSQGGATSVLSEGFWLLDETTGMWIYQYTQSQARTQGPGTMVTSGAGETRSELRL